MQRLRTARHLARLVLAWFALSLGVAIASPLVKPQSIELICSGSGAMKVLLKSGDGAEQPSSHTLDCPLCASLAAPPPQPRTAVQPPHPLSHALQRVAAAHIAWATAAPLPARGPPHP